MLSSLDKRKMIIGVDRLDYSKGLALRMEGFEQFLMANPQWRNEVTYLQITPKSRSEIDQYVDMERHIGETVGRINGSYADVAWTPIRYVNRAYTRSVLAGLYRAARAALVTPLRDGMNLVAKEYIAAQDAEDPGVLILSRFAGAAVECEAALLVNPYDAEAVGGEILHALEMPLDERKARHDALYQVLAANDIKLWGERFMTALTVPPGVPTWSRQMSA
jgi:trehalose 6-phosphate synthase